MRQNLMIFLLTFQLMFWSFECFKLTPNRYFHHSKFNEHSTGIYGLPKLKEYDLNKTATWTTEDDEHLHQPKADPEKDVLFYLYTRLDASAKILTVGDSKGLNTSGFDPLKPTKVVIHGYGKSYLKETVQLIKSAYLESRDVNVIGVDWSALAKKPRYFWAAKNTQLVGEQVGRMGDWLVLNGAKVKDFHLIGHSLGAHVAGFAANYIKAGRIPRITGLDPARPMFELPLRSPTMRLDPTDADVVDCIHTCGKYLGFYTPLGTHDFYPNGGSFSQPGCFMDWAGSCSHMRSVYLFAESINSSFKAQSCSSFAELETKDCSDGQEALMGDPAVNWPGGLYYLTTNDESPFAKL